jgi:6-phosphogluconolactonase
VSAHLIIGCYTKGHDPIGLGYYTNHGDGVLVICLDTTDGSLSVTDGPVLAGTNPTFAAYDAGRSALYLTNEVMVDGCVKAFRLRDGKLTPLNSQPAGGLHPCYLSVAADSHTVLCAKYVSGCVTAFPTGTDGSLHAGVTTPIPANSTYPGPVATRQDGPKAHCYHPLGAGVALCCDLGSDVLLALRIDDGSVCGHAALPPGSGPRHVAVSKDGAWVYVSTELANTIVAVPADAAGRAHHGTSHLGTVAAVASILPAGYAGPPTTAAHIELSPCGRFAYVANRVGVDVDAGCANAAEGLVSVVALAPGTAQHLALVECVPIGGKVPRSFCVVPPSAAAAERGVGGWLVVGAQESSLLRCFAIDGASGRLAPTGHQLDVPSPGVVALAA